MIGVAVIVGAALTGALAGKEMFLQQLQELFLGFTTGFFLTGATMSINDYYDREVDAINEPKRPIPSGLISPNEALAFASFLTIIAFATASLTNWKCLIVAIVAWLVFVLYQAKGKRMGLLGNLMVSVCIAMPFIYGSFVAERELVATTSIFVAIVFLSNTGREITKGIVDIQGDKASNIKTIAVLYGEHKAAVAATIFYLSAVSLTPLPWLLRIVSVWFLPFVVLTDIGLVSTSLSLLLDHSRENARRTKNRNFLWFSTGLLAFIAGTLG